MPHDAVDLSARPLLEKTKPHDPVAAVRSVLDPAGPAVPGDAPPESVLPQLWELLLLEYTGQRPSGPPAGNLYARATALLRGDVRRSLPRHPAILLYLLAAPAESEVADGIRVSAVADAFALCVSENRAAATAAIRAALSRENQRQLAFLLDLAEWHRLDVAAPQELADLMAGDRRARHAAWRYLSGRTGDRAARALLGKHLLSTDDPYERLLLTAALHRLGARPSTGHPLWPPPSGSGSSPGITVAQSMLLGLAEQPGAGSSGGLSVLLASLGDALAEHQGIARVVTVVLCPSSQWTTLDSLADVSVDHADIHLLLRVPVDSPRPLAQPELAQNRAAIRWWLRNLFHATGVSPDVVHVRYADDGSLAVAETAAAEGAALVFTVTADPHRAISRRYRAGQVKVDEAALETDLHRMYLADRLVDLADQVVAIPGRRGDGELRAFFPQLESAVTRPVRVIEEGISLYRSRPSDEPAQRQLVESLFAPHSTLPRLADSARGRPVILCVGRLHPVKQQDILLEAWLSEHLYEQCSLVLVGGALDEPASDEERMMTRLLALAAAEPAAAGALAVLPAVGNAGIRMLEHGIQRFLPAQSPHLYVCPSAKEEFGIAVLEAMDAGYLIGGPRRGGLGHYIRDQHNGYLLDTGSAGAFAADLVDLVTRCARSPIAHRMIAEAGRETVRRRFGITQVAGKFAETYLDLTDTFEGATA